MEVLIIAVSVISVTKFSKNRSFGTLFTLLSVIWSKAATEVELILQTTTNKTLKAITPPLPSDSFVSVFHTKNY